MLIRSDPKFRSEYNFDQDDHVTLPEDKKNSAHIIHADEEFNRLMNSLKYSIGSASIESPERALISDKSSSHNARISKYTALHKSEEKVSTRNQRSKELLFRAGGSVLSSMDYVPMTGLGLNNQSDILDRTNPINVSEHMPKYSDIYPTSSTALPSNSTMIRIRGEFLLNWLSLDRNQFKIIKQSDGFLGKLYSKTFCLNLLSFRIYTWATTKY